MVVTLKYNTYEDETYYPSLDHDSSIHLCNLCNGHEEHYFNADNIENLFQIINYFNAGSWLMSFSLEKSKNESWNNPDTMMGKIFDRFYYNRYDFNGSNTKCVIIRLRNEAIKYGRFTN